MNKTAIDCGTLLEKIRKESPVVHHLTNWVTIYDCAQVVKTLGAFPGNGPCRGRGGRVWRTSLPLWC